jgi:hypothetical protein
MLINISKAILLLQYTIWKYISSKTEIIANTNKIKFQKYHDQNVNQGTEFSLKM